MALELLGVTIPIMGAVKLTSYLLSVGKKLFKKKRARLKPNIGVGVGGDVDDDGCETDLQLIETIDNFKLQLKRRSHSKTTNRANPTVGSRVHAVRRIVADELVGIRSHLRQHRGKSSEEAGEVRENSDNVRYAVVNGLEGEWYALSDDSLVLNKTLEELRAMRGGITRAEENSQATLEEMKRIEEIIHQFHSENQTYYREFLSKLTDMNQGLIEMSKKLDDIQMRVVQLQVAPLEEARAHLNEFTASEGEELKHLDGAYECSIRALSATCPNSLDVLFFASIIAVSTSYAKNTKRSSLAKAKIRVFNGTFKTLTEKLKSYWSTEFSNINTEGLKVVEFLMDIASFICMIPPENVVLPSLNGDLVQVFGRLCVLKPEMLQRYPELAEAARASFLLTSLGTLPQNKDNFGPDVIQSLLDSEKPKMSDALVGSRPKSTLPKIKACRRTAQSWFNLRLENGIGLPKDYSQFYLYAEKGFLSRLKALFDEEGASSLDKTICKHAAKGGHRDVLEWLCEKDCPWDSETCAAAAHEGHLGLLQWARANGCPWNETTCSAAAYGGHLNVLQWARENGCRWDARTCAAAALGGHLKVLRWARENNCPWDKKVCLRAAFNGHMEVLKWARRKGCDWDELVCSMAALGGHLETLQWARASGCPWGKETCALAALGGHLEILQWARAEGCPWNAKTCTYAAMEGHRHVLEWARESGCPWEKETCTEAANEGFQDIVEWARENGCP